MMIQMTKLHHHLEHVKGSVFGFVCLLPTSLLALFMLILLACNGFSVFYLNLPVPAKPSPEPANLLLPENLPADKTVTKLASSVMYAVKEENLPVILKTHFPLLQKPNLSTVKEENLPVIQKTHFPPLQKPNVSTVPFVRPRRSRSSRQILRILRSGKKAKSFSSKVHDFFQNSKCKSRFFMTWISTVELPGDRELLAIESVFKSHPKACLVIVSNLLDSKRGNFVLKPFLDKGFKIIAVNPDFDFIFKNTHAELWFNQLKKGNVNPGEIALGQNLSNLLRLALLYKYGGIYLDTDIIVLKSLNKLRNVIGAQSMNPETKNWTRLNNAVLIFDKQHPLLYKFIQEFALTFDGNKWGHNGPYLVSRVVARVSGRPGFNFTVLPPWTFYPVDWSRIQSFFQGPRDEVHSKWLQNKLEQIRRQSFAVHLWNRQSSNVRVEEGSILHHIVSDCCIFCNSSKSSL